MRAKKYLQALSFLCIISLVHGHAISSNSPVTIDNISIQSGVLATKVLLTSPEPLPILDSYYMTGSSPVLAIELENTIAPIQPKLLYSRFQKFVFRDRLDTLAHPNPRLLSLISHIVPFVTLLTPAFLIRVE